MYMEAVSEFFGDSNSALLLKSGPLSNFAQRASDHHCLTLIGLISTRKIFAFRNDVAKLVTCCPNKKAELSQRWPRDAPNIWVP